jgi:pimeloyl-ACP methyl ester carboxylesterase
MRSLSLLAAAAALLAGAPAAAQPQAPAPIYAQDSTWLCLPGRSDSCSTPLATTALNPNGYGSTGLSSVAKDPPIDCFYVYPTVSSDPGMNSDLTAGREEKLAAEAQFARFSSVCRPFAPIYRQMTVSAVAAYSAGADITPAAELAYRDVAAAFRNYLDIRNKGRKFVLIGHSQGSLLLQQLIAREIENRPQVAARMMLAIIPGYDVLVPQGKLVGGTFKKTPLCNAAAQTHCVMSWTSFRERNAPPEGAMFGYADRAGMTVGCVNPALPGSRGWVKLDSYWFARSSYPVPGGPISWSSEGAPPSPYLRTEGLVSARCINDGQRGYLSVHTNADPNDKRTDRIGGEVGILGMFLPGWGMHLADIAIAQGDLIREVGDISVQSRTAAPR